MLRQVVFASVLEAVEIGHCYGPGKVDERGEDVLCVPIPRHHEGCCPEVAALDPKRTATCSEGKLLNGADVHVQDPELLFLLGRHKDQVGSCDIKASHLKMVQSENRR